MPVAHQRLPALRYLVNFNGVFIQIHRLIRILKAPAILIHVRWRYPHADAERVQETQKASPATIWQLPGVDDAAFRCEVVVYFTVRPALKREPAVLT